MKLQLLYIKGRGTDKNEKDKVHYISILTTSNKTIEKERQSQQAKLTAAIQRY